MIKNLIIIPYRDREEHLDGFMNKALPFFEELLESPLILIVEQSDSPEESRLFNRGALINIGVREYLHKTDFIFTHDVDFYPSRSMVINLYKTIVPHKFIWGIYTSTWDTLAPIIKMTPQTFSLINGFPNNFWGWGEEDKALQNRAEAFGIEIKKNELMQDTLTTLENDKFTLRKDHHEDCPMPSDGPNRAQFEYKKFKTLPEQEKFLHINSSGLNDLSYKITEDSTPRQNVRHIKVDLSLLECNIDINDSTIFNPT